MGSHNRTIVFTFTNYINTNIKIMSKQILVLVLTLLPLLHAQSLCPFLQDPKYDPCTDVCIMDMKQTLDSTPTTGHTSEKSFNSSITLVTAVSMSSVGWSGKDTGYLWPSRPAGTQAWMLA